MHWLLCIDLVLQRMIGRGMQHHLAPACVKELSLQELAAVAPCPCCPIPWPFPAIRVEGWNALRYATYQMDICAVPLVDPSHRVWNDVKAAFTASGLWPFILLMVICFNSDYGPWDGAAFFERAKESMEMVWSKGGMSHPLVDFLLPGLMRELVSESGLLEEAPILDLLGKT